jgi:secreted trypsin-like serine protease
MLKSCRRASRSKTAFVAALAMVTLGVGTGVASASVPSRGVLHAAQRLARDLRSSQRTAGPAIVGGSQISIEQAPWQVVVFAFVPSEEVVLICGGSILDATHVLTAAHCLYSPAGSRLPPEDVVVVAGVSDLESEHEEHAQFRLAEELRVHPYYSYSRGGSPDDVAVVGLTRELALSSGPGSTASSIGMVSAGATPAEGSLLNLAGYGEENASSEELNGTLNSIGMTLGFSRQCGHEADAVFLCASASTGSACFGDSGSGLTTSGATPLLVGVMNTVTEVSGTVCGAGSTNGFVNLAAPEIRDFIEGESTPPEAPRGGNGIEVSGVPKVGDTLTCQPGSWSNQPTITYLFIDSSSGTVLQSGPSSTYQLSAGDVGRTIFCEVQATNSGGTGMVRTTSLRAIEPAPASPQPPATPSPTPPPSGATTGSGAITPPAAGGVEAATVHHEVTALTSTSLTVQSNGMALAKLDCKELEGCNGVLALTAKQTIRLKSGKKKTHTVTIGTANFALGAGKTGTVKIRLNATGRALLSAAHGHLPASLSIEVSEVPTQTERVQLVAEQTGHGSRKGKG